MEQLCYSGEGYVIHNLQHLKIILLGVFFGLPRPFEPDAVSFAFAFVF